MIANANYGGTESPSQSENNATGMSTSYRTNYCGSSGPSISFISVDDPINLLHEDEFFEEICKKSIRMESK